MQYEGIIQLAASLPNGSGLRDELSGSFIKTLWNNLEHPPISYLGQEFKYRTADGSNNVRPPWCSIVGSRDTDPDIEYHVPSIGGRREPLCSQCRRDSPEEYYTT